MQCNYLKFIIINPHLTVKNYSTGTEIVVNAGRKQCKAHLQSLKVHFADSLTKVRQSLAAPKLNQDELSANLNELLTSLILNIVEKIKGILQDLLVNKLNLKVFLTIAWFLLYRFSFNQI